MTRFEVEVMIRQVFHELIAGLVVFKASTVSAPVTDFDRSSPDLEATSYMIEGLYTAQFFQQRTNVSVSEQIYQFVITVNSNFWRLSVLRTNLVKYCYAGDGGATVEWLEDPDFDNLPRPTIITYASYPSDGYIGFIPWLAYASSHYFFRGQNDVPHPTITASQSPQAFMYRADISLAPGAPHLPARIVYTVDKSRKHVALKHPLLRLEGLYKGQLYERRKGIHQLVDGQIRAVYFVEEWTNVGQLHIPYSATVQVFVPDSTNRLVSHHRLIATNAILGPIPVAWPTNPVGWSIVDRRFRVERQGIDCIHYLTNKLLPAIQDPRLLKLFDQKKASFPFLRLDFYWKLVVWFFFALLLLFPIVVAGARWRLRRHKDFHK